MDLLITGFSSIFSLNIIFLIFLGVTIGIIFGAIPGLTATMAIALSLPMTYGMSPTAGMSLLMGLYIGGISGGLIPAILLNIPGTPASIATTFDGSPLAQSGNAGKALGIAIVYSFLGGLFSIFVLMLIAPPLAKIALKFGPFEYFAIALFAITLVGSLSGKSLIKGIISGLIGMMFAMVGSAPIDASARFTFGIYDLTSGFSLLSLLIGLFAVSEILKIAENKDKQSAGNIANFKIKGFGFKFSEVKGETVNFFRSSILGTAIGILPGIGSGTSNLIAYLVAKKQAKNPQEYGKGAVGGIISSESANNASVGGALVPLLTLGIPGDTVTALLLGGLMLHGLMPGPMLFRTSGDIVYAIFAALLLANVFMLVLEFFGIRIFVKLLKIPKYILMPTIMSLCIVGAYGINNRMFDVYSLFFFGIIGYLMDKFEFPLPPVVLGFILAPIIETNLRRGLMSSNGSFYPMLTQPISLLFISLTIISVTFTIKNKRKINNKGKKDDE